MTTDGEFDATNNEVSRDGGETWSFDQTLRYALASATSGNVGSSR